MRVSHPSPGRLEDLDMFPSGTVLWEPHPDLWLCNVREASLLSYSPVYTVEKEKEFVKPN